MNASELPIRRRRRTRAPVLRGAKVIEIAPPPSGSEGAEGSFASASRRKESRNWSPVTTEGATRRIERTVVESGEKPAGR